MRDIDIAILSVCLSVRDTLVLYENGSTYRHSFFSPYGSPIILVVHHITETVFPGVKVTLKNVFPGLLKCCPEDRRPWQHCSLGSKDKCSPYYAQYERWVRSWSQSPGSQPTGLWLVINPAVGCHYFPLGPKQATGNSRSGIPGNSRESRILGGNSREFRGKLIFPRNFVQNAA